MLAVRPRTVGEEGVRKEKEEWLRFFWLPRSFCQPSTTPPTHHFGSPLVLKEDSLRGSNTHKYSIAFISTLSSFFLHELVKLLKSFFTDFLGLLVRLRLWPLQFERFSDDVSSWLLLDSNHLFWKFKIMVHTSLIVIRGTYYTISEFLALAHRVWHWIEVCHGSRLRLWILILVDFSNITDFVRSISIWENSFDPSMISCERIYSSSCIGYAGS